MRGADAGRDLREVIERNQLLKAWMASAEKSHKEFDRNAISNVEISEVAKHEGYQRTLAWRLEGADM